MSALEQISFTGKTECNFVSIGGVIDYYFEIKNNTDKTIKNVNFQPIFGEELSFVSGSLLINGDNQENLVCNDVIALNNIEASEKITINISIRLIKNVYNSSINMLGRIKFSNEDSKITSIDAKCNVVKVETVDFFGEAGENFIVTTSNTNIKLNDTITYKLTLKNRGNIGALDAKLIIPIPYNTVFEKNSLFINGEKAKNNLVRSGIHFESIVPNENINITYKVKAISIPRFSKIENQAVLYYKYKDREGVKAKEQTILSKKVVTNIYSPIINALDGSFVKTVENSSLKLGDTVTIRVYIKNMGNLKASKVYISENLPQDLEFVKGTFSINGDLQLGLTDVREIRLPDIEENGEIKISYKAKVISLPKDISFCNSSTLSYEFGFVNSDENERVFLRSNDINLNIISAVIQSNSEGIVKTVDKAIATINDILTYNIKLKNVGNTKAYNIFFRDELPPGTNFVKDSFRINGIIKDRENPKDGVFLGLLDNSNEVEVSYQVKVLSLEEPIKTSKCYLKYSYKLDEYIEEVKNVSSFRNDKTKISAALISPLLESSFEKFVDKESAKINDILCYRVTITNRGNAKAFDVFLKENYIDGVQLVKYSVLINGERYGDINLEDRIYIGDLEVNESVVFSYKVKITDFPSSNPIRSLSKISYSYFVDHNRAKITKTEISKEAITRVNTAVLEVASKVSQSIVSLSDIINCRFVILNSGNIDAYNIALRVNIPEELLLINDKFNVSTEDYYISGNIININKLEPNKKLDISFKLKPIKISDKELKVSLDNSYEYKVSEKLEPQREEKNFIMDGVSIKVPLIEGECFIDKEYLEVSEKKLVSFSIRNTGNLDLNEAKLYLNLPKNVSILKNTATLNGKNIKVTFNNIIELSSIKAGEENFLSFYIIATSLENSNVVNLTSKIIGSYFLQNNSISIEKEYELNELSLKLILSYLDISFKPEDTTILVSEKSYMSIIIKNKGNTEAFNVKLNEYIGDDISVIRESLILDGDKIKSNALEDVIDFGNIKPHRAKVLRYAFVKNKVGSYENFSFKVKAIADFLIDDILVTKSFLKESDSINVEEVKIEPMMSADKEYILKNDVITYSVNILNEGTLPLTIFYQDKNPQGLIFINDSVKINGNCIKEVEPSIGFNAGILKPGEFMCITTRYSYKRVYNSVNIENQAIITYGYYRDNFKSNILKKKSSNIVSLEAKISTFKDFSIEEIIDVSGIKPAIKEISNFYVEPEISNYYIVNTIKNTSYSNESLTGYKLMVRGVLKEKIEYIANNDFESIHLFNTEESFSTFVILPEEYKEGEAINLEIKVQNIFFRLTDDCNLVKSISILIEGKI